MTLVEDKYPTLTIVPETGVESIALNHWWDEWEKEDHGNAAFTAIINVETCGLRGPNNDEDPILLKAGDPRVKINGHSPLVDCRIIAEKKYQKLRKGAK